MAGMRLPRPIPQPAPPSEARSRALAAARCIGCAISAAAVVTACLVASGQAAQAAQEASAAPADAIAARAIAARAIAARAIAAGGPPPVYAAGADLMNAVTGRRLWSRDPRVERPMGSITKVMTALMVIRAGGLGRTIRISKAVAAYPRRHDGSSAGLRAGDILTARQLLEGMLLPSGCDAALALADAYGPGWRAFVRKMNSTARSLGMTRTHFANFDGLPWPTEHSTYSTPAGLMILGRAAMRYAVFRRIVRQRGYYIAASRLHHRYHWRTTNLLLGSYRGAIGIKTGSTLAAGFCLLFEATRGDRTLIGVVLHSTATDPQDRFTDARRLLSWGFR